MVELPSLPVTCIVPSATSNGKNPRCAVVCRYCGYCAHAAKDESSALRLVQILQELASETVPQFRGRIVKFVGDAVLAQFPSAELAVRAAITLSNGYVQRSGTIGHIEHL